MDAEDKRLTEALKPLSDRLTAWVGSGRAMNQFSVNEISEIVKDELTRLRQQGIKCPPLVAIVLPSVGFIDLVRADMKHAGLQVVMSNMVTRFPGIDINEVAQAVANAFPDYRFN